MLSGFMETCVLKLAHIHPSLRPMDGLASPRSPLTWLTNPCGHDDNRHAPRLASDWVIGPERRLQSEARRWQVFVDFRLQELQICFNSLTAACPTWASVSVST